MPGRAEPGRESVGAEESAGHPHGKAERMSSIAEKLGRIKEAEDRAEGTLEDYRKRAEELIAGARAESEKAQADMEAKARSEGEAEMKGMVEEANREARALRERFKEDAARMRETVAARKGSAVRFVLEKLEKGE